MLAPTALDTTPAPKDPDSRSTPALMFDAVEQDRRVTIAFTYMKIVLLNAVLLVAW